MGLRAGVWYSQFVLLFKKSSYFGWPAAVVGLLPGFFVWGGGGYAAAQDMWGRENWFGIGGF